MKVVLLADVKGSGKRDQIIDVSDGYARNFLFPRKLAKEATAENINAVKLQQSAEAHRKELQRKDALETAKKMENLVVNVTGKSGKDGKLFGSIGTKEVADALKQQHNITIDKKKIELSSTIKTPGEYTAEIRLFPDISTKVKVVFSV